jgi:rod shape-determining protein MreD
MSLISSEGGAQTGRNVTAAFVTVGALILQVAVFNRLPLPGQVTPDLVLLTVVALALLNGEMVGAVAGFCAGLAADIVPPADHTIGRYALVYCLVGYVSGLLSDSMDRSSVVPFVAVAAGALFGTLLYAAVGMLLGDPRATGAVIARIVPVQVLYDVLASPFVIWLVMRLTRRVERAKEPRRRDLAVPSYRGMSRERALCTPATTSGSSCSTSWSPR